MVLIPIKRTFQFISTTTPQVAGLPHLLEHFLVGKLKSAVRDLRVNSAYTDRRKIKLSLSVPSSKIETVNEILNNNIDVLDPDNHTILATEKERVLQEMLCFHPHERLLRKRINSVFKENFPEKSFYLVNDPLGKEHTVKSIRLEGLAEFYKNLK